MTEARVKPIRWGVIGTGGIASSFADDLQLLPDASLVAVGSRRQVSADEFADRHDVPHRHASYDALAVDEDVDVVYVATPHPDHHGSAMLAIDAGKAVLVEKPLTVNASEANALVEAARSRRVFLMEAMWTRFLPHVQQVRSLINSGELGDVRLVIADYCQRFERDATSRFFDPALGGGALLDLGVYPVSFASMILGTPSRVTAVSDPAFTGVDASTSIVLQHPDGAQASLTMTMQAVGPTRVVIVGTNARIEIDSVAYSPSTFTLIGRDGSVVRYDEPHEGGGLRHEATEVMRCLREGRLESDLMPLDETVAVMQTLDEVRRQIGLRYPGE